MGLSKRERMIVLVTILSVGALVADRFVRAPLANRLSALKSERDKAVAEVEHAKVLFQQSQQVQRKTRESGGLKQDAEAESSVAKALDQWAAQARLTLTSVKPDRMAGDKGVKEILFVVAGKGSLDAVAWFLYQVETSQLPIKVKYVQLGSASEAGDSMSLELRLSTLYLAADEKPSSQPSQPRPTEKNDEEQLL
jgi:hypothetical protein